MSFKNARFFVGSLILALGMSLGLVIQAHATAPEAQLQQYIADLGKNPDDQALREKVIQAVLSSGSAPAMPEEALKQAGKAKAIMGEAQSKEDYKSAVKAFQKASLLAPWNAGLYFNLAVAQEKAGHVKDAVRSLNLYLLADPNAKDKEQVKEKIGGLEYKAEKAGKEKTANEKAKKGTMVLIPAGEFWMGSKDGDGDEKPRHKVWVDAFYIDTTEVTNAQFQRFAEAAGYVTEAERGDGGFVYDGSTWNKVVSSNWKDPEGRGLGISRRMNHPVVQVTWADANAFCKWAGKRLPTEAEWEKAARGGTETKYFFGDNAGSLGDYAWYSDNSGNTTHPVRNLKPNSYGLYDILGNVWEWCSDWYKDNYYQKSPEKNPKGPDSGEYRVFRGGSWNFNAGNARPAVRYRNGPGDRSGGDGCRCARTP